MEDPWGLVITPPPTLVVLRNDAWVSLPCSSRTHQGLGSLFKAMSPHQGASASRKLKKERLRVLTELLAAEQDGGSEEQ